MSYELLNSYSIRQSVGSHNLPYLLRVEIFDTIDSTNSYLLAAAKQGAPSGTVCLAEEQTKGRGRLERPWFSPYGSNIYCSFLWRFDPMLPDISSLSIAVGVMLVNVLQKYGINTAIQLKWPNDVFVHQRKLAGILLEGDNQGSVVIGIGLNVDIQAAGERNWIDLMEITKQPIARNQLVGLLLNELLEQLPLYARDGAQSFLTMWKKYDVLYNQQVTVHVAERKICGIACGINEKGEFLLKNEQGILQSFGYGEVSVR